MSEIFSRASSAVATGRKYMRVNFLVRAVQWPPAENTCQKFSRASSAVAAGKKYMSGDFARASSAVAAGRLLGHGRKSTNASLEGFQCDEFASGEIATPASPIAPDLESGAISKKGTAVVIVFNCKSNSVPPLEAWPSAKFDTTIDRAANIDVFLPNMIVFSSKKLSNINTF